MQITVFGSTGKVGRLVVQEAIWRGHTVVAFQRRPPPSKTFPNIRFVQGDIYDAAAVKAAITGSDAAISTLGSWGTPRKNILSVGMSAIIPAMQAEGISRIVTVTGAEARAAGDHLSIIHRVMHTLLGLAAGKVLRDSETHIAQLENSDLDYTVIRSPIMTNSGNHISYTLTKRRPLPWQTVNRHAVARCIVDQIELSTQSQSAPFIT